MPRKSRKNVGLIGLGIIGTRVASVLRSAGSHVFVWSRTPKSVPNFLGSPTEVAEICEVIQLFVSDAQAVIDAIESFSDALTSNHVIINCATIGPEATREAARLVQEKGAAFLDAPFTGSKIAAEKGQLCYYIGGDDAVFQRVKPILEATSRAIVKCGKVGDAATLKVATNLITAVTTQTLAEAMTIVQRSGIAPEIFAAAIEQNACKSGVIELKLPKMVRGDFEPHFSLKHMFKDVQLGIHMANSFNLEVPVTTVTAGVMYGALNNGWAELDFSSVFRIYSDTKNEETGSELPAAEAAQQIEDKKEPEPELTGGGQIVEAEVVGTKGLETEGGTAATEVRDVKVDTVKGATEDIAARAPEPISEIVMGDIFKRRAPEPVEPVELKVEEPKGEETKAATGPEPVPAIKADEVIKPASTPDEDIPQVIFGRVVPSPQEKKDEDAFSNVSGEDLKGGKDESVDLEKTFVPPPITSARKDEEKHDEAAREESKVEGSVEANLGDKAKEGRNGVGYKVEAKPEAEEPPRFRPLQRIRRFFSPAGK